MAKAHVPTSKTSETTTTEMEEALLNLTKLVANYGESIFEIQDRIMQIEEVLFPQLEGEEEVVVLLPEWAQDIIEAVVISLYAQRLQNTYDLAQELETKYGLTDEGEEEE